MNLEQTSQNRLRVIGKTDTGAVREHNEDAFYCDEEQGLVVIADGMGGYAAGEVASDIVVKTLAELSPAADGLVAALIECHQRIVNHAQLHPQSKGMGAAVVAARANASQVSVCWAGDARAYLFHPGQGLNAISRDHSYVQWLLSQGQLTEEQARAHPDRHLVTQCLGLHPPQPERVLVNWAQGDILLLCSDGLTDELDDAMIGQILQGSSSLATSAAQLIEAALAAGGRDNITVVLAENLAVAQSDSPSPEASDAESAKAVSWQPVIAGILGALLVALVGAFFLMKN